MKLIYIIQNAIKRKMKDFKSLGIMTAFPILLTFIFITVFGNINTGFKADVKDNTAMKLSIYSEAEQDFNKSLTAFLDEVQKKGSISFQYQFVAQKEQGTAQIEKKQIDLFVQVNKAHEVILSKGQDAQKKADVFKAVMQKFMEYTALSELTKENHQQSITQNEQLKTDAVYSVKAVKADDKNFYILSIAVTMISFAVLMAGSYGCAQVYYINKPVGKRVQSAPLSKNIIYLGEYIAGVIMAFIQGSVMTIICELFFNIGYSNNILSMAAILLLLSMMSVAIGICVGAVLGNERLASGMISVIIMILCFTSGGLNPNMNLGGIVQFSPITVVNKAVIAVCLQEGSKAVMQAAAVMLIFTVIVLGIAAVSINKRFKEVC